MNFKKLFTGLAAFALVLGTLSPIAGVQEVFADDAVKDFSEVAKDLDVVINGKAPNAEDNSQEIMLDKDGNFVWTLTGKDITSIEFDHNYDGKAIFDFEDVLTEKLDPSDLSLLTGLLEQTLSAMELPERHLYPNSTNPFNEDACGEEDPNCIAIAAVLEALGIEATYTEDDGVQHRTVTIPSIVVEQFEDNSITFYHTAIAEDEDTGGSKKYGTMYGTTAGNTFAYTFKAYEKPSSNSGGSGGGYTIGGGSNSSDTPADTDTDTSDDDTDTDTDTDSRTSAQEQSDAYEFAYEYGITTMGSLAAARVADPVTRAEFAKMISVFAEQFTDASLDIDASCVFADLDAVNDELAGFIQKACQYGIMGQNMGDNFRPNDVISRAEVATTISRLLGLASDGDESYYAPHLQAMMDAGYITQDTPDLAELRGYMFIMLQRIAETE